MQRNEFDAVIVGSGFGGSVMAHNLSKAGMKVCVLERGKAYKPGEFARTPDQLNKAFWDPSNALYGLFNLWSFKDFDAVVASGLGGGSLIYANVILPKPENWFESIKPGTKEYENWPISYKELAEHYANVKKILEPSPFPAHLSPYDETPKHAALKNAAESTNLEFVPVDLAISFGNEGQLPVPGVELTDGANLHNVRRYACRLCGECYIGCNYGSKNTLDFNYLTFAKNHHVDIRTLAEVISFRQISDGYEISYRDLDKAAKQETKPAKDEALVSLKCTYFILSAGTFGTTYLLLKNKVNFPNISPMLGHSFSGNGDLFTVALDTRTDDGGTEKMRNLKPYLGPTITGALKSDPEDKNSRFYIEDWSYPAILVWFLQSMHLGTTARRWWEILSHYIEIRFGFRRSPDLGKDASKLFDDADSAVYSFPMVGMGMAEANGVMNLSSDGFLSVKYSRKSSAKFFRNIVTKMRKISDSLRAKRFADLPTWYLDKTITVHPLGGCPIGNSVETGVVDSFGEVYNYKNMFIADGSVLPASIGPNPSFTIAALSDRFSLNLVKRWSNSQTNN